MHCATMKSPRLQSLLKFLQDGRIYTTREIIKGTGLCAINSAVSELRFNGYEIDCQQIARGRFIYQLRGAISHA